MSGDRSVRALVDAAEQLEKQAAALRRLAESVRPRLSGRPAAPDLDITVGPSGYIELTDEQARAIAQWHFGSGNDGRVRDAIVGAGHGELADLGALLRWVMRATTKGAGNGKLR